jgi:hypothetical protein
MCSACQGNYEDPDRTAASDPDEEELEMRAVDLRLQNLLRFWQERLCDAGLTAIGRTDSISEMRGMSDIEFLKWRGLL